MKIKMNRLVITEYCSNDQNKYRFTKEIKEDPFICCFVSSKLDEWIKQSEGLDRILIGPTYIVADGEKLVGTIRLAYFYDGVATLHYAVHPNYRKQHYGSSILLETSQYLLHHTSGIKQIKLCITSNNPASIKCAENAKFILEREFPMIGTDMHVKVYVKK